MNMDYKKFFMELLEKLVSMPSVSENEEECAEFLADILRSQVGMEVEVRRVEGKGCNVYAVKKGRRACGEAACEAAGGQIYGTDETGGGKACGLPERALLLGGHIDVVPPGDGWTYDPFSMTVCGDKAYGRGTFDMKGGLAAQIAVLKRFADEGDDFCGIIELIGVCDEERLSIGANAYVDDVKNGTSALPIGKAQFGIFGEPHFDNIVVGATGKVLLELKVQGVSGHAAKPESGVNAVNCMTKLLNALDEKYTKLYEDGKAASHCVLKIESKYESYSLSIPEECTALLNKQLYIEENVDAFIEDVYKLYDEYVGQGKLTVERRIPYYPSYEMDHSCSAEGADSGFGKLLEVLKDKYDHKPELRINPSVSDANVLYPSLGIPVILFGPDGANLHKPDEYISISSAYRYMDMLYDFINEYFK